MIPAYTGTQIRAAEKPFLEQGFGPELMRRAAHGLAQHAMALLRTSHGGVYGRRVAALVGSGNNGGDALFAMAQLARRGVACTAVLVSATAHADGLAAFTRAGGKVVKGAATAADGSRGSTRRWRHASTVIDGVDLVIDAVLGTGARGSVSLPPVPEHVLVLACDLPSGVDANTGNAPEGVIRADLTVTFGALKTGLAVGRGQLLAGRVAVVDIGLGASLGTPELYVMTRAAAAARLPHPAPADHKYSRGVLGLIAGSDAYPGAAVLAATAAVHAGVGMLRTVSTGAAAERIADAVPEAVAAGQAEAGTEDGPQVAAWAMGPGLGTDGGQHEAVHRALASGKPCVVDAGALALVAPDSGHSRMVLTPHAGELRRLLARLDISVGTEDITADPVRWARWAAVGFSCVVLLKGPATVCAAPDGYTVISNGAPPSLATAGSGDVLTGMLGAFVATGFDDDDGPRELTELAAAAAEAHSIAGHLAGDGGAFGAGKLASLAGEAVRALRR